MTRPLLFAALSAAAVPALAAAFAAAAPAAAQEPLRTPPLAGTRLDVSATGEVRRVPDVATIGAGVVSQATTAAKAMADNARAMTATVAALRRAGIADRDLQTASLSLQPQYRYGDNQPPVLTGYQASNRVTVRLRDLARAGGVIDALVAAGANQIDGPTLGLDQPDTALDEARTAAVAIARRRAELYARAAGLRVKRIVAISEAGEAAPPRPVPMMMMKARADAATPIEAGESALAVTVNVTFELD